MDKAREALQGPSESLWSALQRADLSVNDTEQLRDYLLLRGEIARHKADPHGYEPPRGDVSERWVREAAPGEVNAWPLISAFRKGAQQVIDAAYSFGLKFDELKRPDGHEAGRKWFPSLADRLHLGAVVAKCGAFCAHAEVFVKNLRREGSADHLSPDHLWPEEAPELVERYNRHLGLDVSQQIKAYQESQVAEVEKTPSQETEVHEPCRDTGHDYGH